MVLASNTVEESKVPPTVRHPEGVIVILGDGVQGQEGYQELCDPKGTNSTLIEGTVIPKLSNHPELCTKECSSRGSNSRGPCQMLSPHSS